MKHFVLLPLLLLISCNAYREPISSRPIPSLEKGDGKMNVIARPVPSPSPIPELYTRQKELKIKPASVDNETGSLMNLADNRNYLFTPRNVFNPGQALNIKVASNRIDAPKSAPASANASQAAPIAGGDDFENNLLKSFPNLEGAGPDKPNLIRQFKMEVTHQLENGDAMVVLKRVSMRGDYANEILVKARIPFDRLVATDDLTTNDLADVSWNESLDGQFIERSSPNWEDEYTARLSGFDEAKSKAALALQEQRKQLQDIRGKLDTRLRTAANERQQVSKLREDLNRKAQENEAKLEENRQQLADRTKELEDTKKELEDMKKENKLKANEKDAAAAAAPAADKKAPAKGAKLTEKPADKKDGSYGKK